jgi:hypothetical protein
VNTTVDSSTTNEYNENANDDVAKDPVHSEASSALTIREQLLSVQASENHSGIVEVSNVQIYIQEDTVMQSTRSSTNRMFSSMFSTSIQRLYWYRPYFAMLNKFHAVCCNCMLECGNILVMLMETRCPNPHYHPVIYYTATKECVIIQKKPSRWPLKNFVLCPNKPLTVIEDEIER